MIKGLEAEIEAIKNWAQTNPLIQKVYIYGSFVNGNFNNDSDLDVAIEINKQEGDTNKMTTWICQAKEWRKQLQPLLRFKLHLEWYDPVQTLSVHNGIHESSFLIYDKE